MRTQRKVRFSYETDKFTAGPPARFEYGGARFIDPTTELGDGESTGHRNCCIYCMALTAASREDL